ncbi:PAS domain S-box protein [Candidatus Gracilibacteria bacterium]|nr:PAS domain S-box protein [Candidatus Gracilibacteria bacterium]NJM88518.1 PAS domain S-box protein [Hydrococcus sp. RU_2_2]NJP21258.1 PAS domain S-box protein [Hydrococcus sp. CRU_1_1]
MTENDEALIFESLLEFLRQARGFDFTGYKRSSLMRRVRKHMQTHNIDNFGDYLDYLQVRPEEFLPLFNTILINVTSFFRDKDAWNYLQRQVIPRLISDKPLNKPIRVWSAGCASGEEAYTLATILAQALGIEKFRQRVKIYATDVDEEALSQARHASYSTKDLEPIPEEIREQFFEKIDNQYIFRPDLRRSVIFGRHDLVQDAPISRLDLLVCRNTLMYFNAEIQVKILNRFHFALNDTGILFLGKAEMLLTHTNLFTPISLQQRIFRPVIRNERRNRPLTLGSNSGEEANYTLERYNRLRESAFDSVALSQIIVDFNGNLVIANTPARAMFGLNPLDLGRPLQDLEISYRPLELRSYIEEVYRNRTNIVVNDVVRNLRDNQTQYLDVHINLLEDNIGEILGVGITFTDVTRYQELKVELQQANQELETANEELQSSNEELETTNEELQSTNEELETTNEELQSTNEELETMNEELQSTNEELQTINDELRLRTADLNQANAFLNSILGSLKAGVVVVDRQFNTLSWNEEAENLWGLRAEEVKGQSILNLDIGLPVEQLREPIRNCLSEVNRTQELILEAVNRRGRTIQCRIGINPLNGSERECLGAILLMEEVET